MLLEFTIIHLLFFISSLARASEYPPIQNLNLIEVKFMNEPINPQEEDIKKKEYVKVDVERDRFDYFKNQIADFWSDTHFFEFYSPPELNITSRDVALLDTLSKEIPIVEFEEFKNNLKQKTFEIPSNCEKTIENQKISIHDIYHLVKCAEFLASDTSKELVPLLLCYYAEQILTKPMAGDPIKFKVLKPHDEFLSKAIFERALTQRFKKTATTNNVPVDITMNSGQIQTIWDDKELCFLLNFRQFGANTRGKFSLTPTAAQDKCVVVFRPEPIDRETYVAHVFSAQSPRKNRYRGSPFYHNNLIYSALARSATVDCIDTQSDGPYSILLSKPLNENNFHFHFMLPYENENYPAKRHKVDVNEEWKQQFQNIDHNYFMNNVPKIMCKPSSNQFYLNIGENFWLCAIPSSFSAETRILPQRISPDSIEPPIKAYFLSDTTPPLDGYFGLIPSCKSKNPSYPCFFSTDCLNPYRRTKEFREAMKASFYSFPRPSDDDWIIQEQSYNPLSFRHYFLFKREDESFINHYYATTTTTPLDIIQPLIDSMNTLHQKTLNDNVDNIQLYPNAALMYHALTKNKTLSELETEMGDLNTLTSPEIKKQLTEVFPQLTLNFTEVTAPGSCLSNPPNLQIEEPKPPSSSKFREFIIRKATEHRASIIKWSLGLASLSALTYTIYKKMPTRSAMWANIVRFFSSPFTAVSQD